MAAVSGVAVSVGTGTLAVGSASLLVSSASVAQAAITGPVDDEGMNLEYTSVHYEVDPDDLAEHRDWMHFAGDENVDLQFKYSDTTTKGFIGVQADAGSNLKLTLTGTTVDENITLSSDSVIRSTTLWVTGTSNSLLVGQGTITQDVKSIYVDSVALQFIGSYQGQRELHADLVLGHSDYRSMGSGAGSALNDSTLIIGSGSSSNVITVSTTGKLIVDEGGAKVGFYTAGSSLMVRGAITGSGTLTLDSMPSSPGHLYLLGGGDNFTGVIAFGANASRLYLGQSIELGGLSGGSSGTHVGVYGVSSVTLTLNVAKDADYSYTGRSASRDVGAWDSGINIVKKGAGSQSLANFTGSGITLEEGKLALSDIEVAVGDRGVNVMAGTLEVNALDTTFTGGSVSVAEGATMNMSGDVTMSNAELEVLGAVSYTGSTTDGTSLKLGKVTLGGIRANGMAISNSSLTISGTVDLTDAKLNLVSGLLSFDGVVNGLQEIIEVGKNATLEFKAGTALDISNLGSGVTEVNVDKGSFKYTVDVIHVEDGGSVVGWQGVDLSASGFQALSDAQDGFYRAGLEFKENAVIVQNPQTISVNWLNDRQVEGLQAWQDTISSLAITVEGTITFITGQNLRGDSDGADVSQFNRTADRIFVSDASTLVLCQADRGNNFFTGSAKWREMILMGDLVLRNRDVLRTGDATYNNSISWGANARIIVDWRSSGREYVGTYAFPGAAIGTSSNLPTNYGGQLVVRSGVFELQGYIPSSEPGHNQNVTDRFSSLVVEAGGQVTLRDRVHTNGNNAHGVTYEGNITISGSGLKNDANYTTEPFRSALMLGPGSRIAGNVTIRDAATIHMNNDADTAGRRESYIDGDLLGEGLGRFTFIALKANENADPLNVTLHVAGNVQGIKNFHVGALDNDLAQNYNNTILELQSAFDASNIDAATVESRHFEHLSGNGTLRFINKLTGFDRYTIEAGGTLEVSGGSKAEESDIFDTVGDNLLKDGAGDMRIYRHLDVIGTITVGGGSLYFGDSSSADYRLAAQSIEVMNSCRFIITHNYGDFDTDITLSDATLSNGSGWTGTDSSGKTFHFRSLTVTGGRSELHWADSGNEGFSFDTLTGNGDLHLGTMNGRGSQIFSVDKIVNYSGTVYADIAVFASDSLAKVQIGQVHQDSGQNGAVNMDTLSNKYIRSSNFRKTGAGEFSLNRIAFDTEVWMNYEGTLNLTDTEVKFYDRTVLHYTSADNNRVILSRGIENDSSIQFLYVDILDLSAAQLANGINLGFYANVADPSKISSKLVVGGLDDYRIYTQNGRLYLSSTSGVNLKWDRAMGAVSMAWAPTDSVLSAHTAARPLNQEDWVSASLQLGTMNNYAVTKNGQLTTVVNLANGGGGEYATVVGNAVDGRVLSAYTYIYMAGGDYHMLIGGSANSSTTGTGGIEGGTHIQIEDGEVDYIVGGNHLSTGATTFIGDTYISIMGGELKGGIVGGNTYAGGGGSFCRDSSSQRGSSNIFIYTALANSDKTPTIGVATGYEVSANPFTMIVGGSAYVSDNANRSAIDFFGDSRIVVDLQTYAGESAFDKDIVGGNAYLTANGWTQDGASIDVPNNWNSNFKGDSTISITGAGKDGQAIDFNGIVAGASYHNVQGEHRLTFTGDASVSVRGGNFSQAIAGGFYFGEESIGSHNATLDGDSSVALHGGSFWRAVGGSYSQGTGTGASRVYHTGSTSLEISGGVFSAEEPENADKVDPETWRSFVAGGSYFTANRNSSDSPHEHKGSAKLLVTGGTFKATLLVAGDFLSTTSVADIDEPVMTESISLRGTYADISGATITDALVVGGGYMVDTGDRGGITIEGGTYLTIGEGTKLSAAADSAQHGIAAAAGSYLNVAGDEHIATVTDGSHFTMTGGSVTGSIVGGSVMTGYANELETDYTEMTLSGGSVKGNIYGGHYVGNVAVSPSVSAESSVESISVRVNGSAITGNVFGGGSFSCGEGYGSDDFVQSQGSIVVSLESGSLTGNLYAAGELGRPASIKQPGEDSVTPNGARVQTGTTRVEIGSGFAFGNAKTTVSGDYYLADAKYSNYQGVISGPRTLAFTDDGNYGKVKNWQGISFINFDAIEVAEGGNVKLSADQFTGEDTGFTKLGAGTLELEGALSGAAPVSVYGGILKLNQKQSLRGGLHFDLTGRVANDASSAFLQGLGGFDSGRVDVFIDDISPDAINFGRYYLVSGWNSLDMDYLMHAVNSDTREFILREEGDCLVLQVREKSTNKWLWRGDTGDNSDRVGAYEWDPKSPVNWNAHEMNPNSTESPNGQNLVFTASVGGDVLVGERVDPASVTVESGNYVFKQRSPEDQAGREGIYTSTLTVGGAYQEAVLDLQLDNGNINNIFLKNNGTLMLSSANAITATADRENLNSKIYFDGGTLVYNKEFNRDVSWQVSAESTDIVRVGVSGEFVEENRIVWGKLYDSETVDTWLYNEGVKLALQGGIEKSGEGTLRLIWGDDVGAASFPYERGITGNTTVKEGKLEFHVTGGTPNGGLVGQIRHLGTITVAKDAEFVFSTQRMPIVNIEHRIIGEGTVVLGRQLGDEPPAQWAWGGGTIQCSAQNHGGLLTDIAAATYTIAGDNRDFAGRLVLEGTSDLRPASYVRLGIRYQGQERTLVGYDAETATMTVLGGGQTTLVLAGRHLTIDGLRYRTYHREPNGYEVDPDMLREKYIRAGVVEVAEGTLTYVGSTTHADETDNTRVQATVYRTWDDHMIFTGKLTGSGTLAIAWGGFYGASGDAGNAHYGGSYTQELHGAIDEFTGCLVAGDLQSRRDESVITRAEWILEASGATDKPGERSIINARLAGDGWIVFNYTQDTVLAGAVGDTSVGYGNDIRLQNIGDGTIVIGSNKNTSTGLLYADEGGFDLGDVDHYANWAGTALRGTKDFTLVNGALAAPMTLVEGSTCHIRVETSALGATKVNAGGTKGEDLFEVIINKDGFLTGVYDNIVASRDASYVKLVFSRNNVSTSSTVGEHMIELRFNRSLIVEDEEFFLLDFGVDSIVSLLQEIASAPQAAAYLHVLSKGELKIGEGMWKRILADGGDGARLLSQLGLYIDSIDGGDIVMKSTGSGSGRRAYYVFRDPTTTDAHTVLQYNVLSNYSAVILEGGQTLNLELMGEPEFGTKDYEAGGAVVPNLWGDAYATFKVTNSNFKRGDVTVILDNENVDDGSSMNSNFQGSIIGSEHVNFVKTGGGTLSIGYHDAYGTSGGFEGDSLDIRQGGVVLRGKTNTVRDKLTFSYMGDPVQGEERGLTLLNGSTTVGSIVEAGEAAGPIIMGNNAKLALALDPEGDGSTSPMNTWEQVIVKRQGAQSSETGWFTVQGGTLNLVNTETAQLQGVHLALENDALLNIHCLEGASIASLGGNGSLWAHVKGDLEVTGEGDAVFTGTLQSPEFGVNTLHISKNIGTLTMRNVRNEGLWSLHNDGLLVLDVSGKNSSDAASNSMKFNNLRLGKDSKTTYIINSDNTIGTELGEMVTAESLTVDPGAELTLQADGTVLYTGSELKVAKVNKGNSEGLLVYLDGFSFFLSEVSDVYVDYDGYLKVVLDEVEGNPLIHDNQSVNALAGAVLFTEAARHGNRETLASEQCAELRNMIAQVRRLEGDPAALDQLLAAGAGASTAVLGPALAHDMQRQLRAIRNRTTSMGANQDYVAGNGPSYHAWINAEGDYHKVDADGLAPGYKVSSWGGTVGMDADVSHRTTFGLALTAMYGKLTPDSADKADGNMDTYYLSFFGKTARGRWMHTVVGSIGMANISLDRTVNYGEGSYKTSGSTNGYGIGLMYEVGYSIPMNAEASYAVQPVANVTLRHVNVAGYEETSAGGAQLSVGDNTQTIFTIGAGMRAQAVVGENAYNRASILEGRILAKLDVGDTKGKTETALVNGAPLSMPVEGAELGSVGIEVGVGITIPMDNSKGSIFVDTSAELRSGYTNLNATVGYRMDF